MKNQKRAPVLTMAFTAVLLVGLFGCEKTEGIVSSEETLASVTAEVVDMELAHSVKTALAAQKSLADIDIVVMANNGEVSLRGNVDNQEQYDSALKITKDVTGVESVDNKLHIKEQH